MFFNYRETFNSWYKFCKVIHKDTEQDLSIIVQSQKILLFHNSESWVKKAGNNLFDVSTTVPKYGSWLIHLSYVN